MNLNPYQPSDMSIREDMFNGEDRDLDEKIAEAPELKRKAIRAFRMAVLILLPAAAFNYALFDTFYIAGRFANDLVLLLRASNGIGLVLLFSAFYWIAFPVFDKIFAFAASHFMSHDPEIWQVIFYSGVRRLPVLAIVIAFLWCVWVAGYYIFDLKGLMFAALCSILAHLVAAVWYVPVLHELFLAWYSDVK